MKPIRLDVIKSTGRKTLFIVAGGQKLDEQGEPEQYHAVNGVFGLIVLTPRGANLGVVATTLYEEFETYGRYPQHASVTIHRLGPNGAYGRVAELGDQHSGHDIRWVGVYGVIGNSVELSTTVTSRAVSNRRVAAPFRSNTRSRRSHPQARFIPSYYAFRAFTTRARFAATTAWSSTRARSHTQPARICPTKLSRSHTSRCRSRGRSPLPVRGR